MSRQFAREFDVVIERDAEGCFVATVPALPGCPTQARSLDELMERTKEAIALCLEVQGMPAEGPGLRGRAADPRGVSSKRPVLSGAGFHVDT